MNRNLREYFEDISCESIVGSEFDDTKMISEYIKKRIAYRSNMDILILGCGNGVKEEYIFNNRTDVRIVFIDISQNVINHIKEKFPHAQAIRMDIMDISANTLKKTFDIIYSFSVIQYIKPKELSIVNKNLYALLKNGGIIAHLNIPDKTRRYLYRFNNVLINKNIKYLLKRYDFVDSYSHWISKKCFYGITHSKVTTITPSYNWERYDVIIQKLI